MSPGCGGEGSWGDGCVRPIMRLIGSWGRGSLTVRGGMRGGGRVGGMGGVINCRGFGCMHIDWIFAWESTLHD